MKREVLAYIKQNKMIKKNDVILAGVSGGSDSMAMLHLLKELQQELGFVLRAVHVHHGIRGKEADRDSSFVENVCREWQIPCNVYRYDVPRLSGKWEKKKPAGSSEKQLFAEKSVTVSSRRSVKAAFRIRE